MTMYQLLKPLLFLLSPEKAHHFTFFWLDLAAATRLGRWLFSSLFQVKKPGLETSKMGLRFPNAVGLAAGFDKNGQHIEALAMLGFGFIEVGTVTPRAQDGNPKPRLFRLPKDRAVINRMGFNNDGIDALVENLRRFRVQKRPARVLIGGNIGKNKTTPNAEAEADYAACFERLFDLVDYFVVNVSSPNTPGLRELQEREPLARLLSGLQKMNLEKPSPKPILLKIAPDLTDSQLFDIVSILVETGIAGCIATNTTISRDSLLTEKAAVEAMGAGGLSGVPVQKRSTEVIRFLRKNLPADSVIVGVGGIDGPAAAREKMEAGADLVQVYTGLIFEGPGLVRRILQAF